jgi:hypothetical protein
MPSTHATECRLALDGQVRPFNMADKVVRGTPASSATWRSVSRIVALAAHIAAMTD